MASFLIDEDMPRRTAAALREAGYTALDVREVGLRSHKDSEIFAYAQTHGYTLVSRDMGFANTLTFPPGTHHGIVVIRLPNSAPISRVILELQRVLEELSGTDHAGSLVIVETGRTRIRRPSQG